MLDAFKKDLVKSINSEEFQKVKDELVKKYNITASAKYTLTPRDDFINKVIKEFIEIAAK